MSNVKYEHVPNLNERLPLAVNLNQVRNTSFMQKHTRKLVFIIATLMLTLAGAFLSLIVTGVYNKHYSTGITATDSKSLYQSQQVLPLLGFELKDISYCKVQCANPCSKFPSMYGDLCCDWSPLLDGGQICFQIINKDGVCTCGIPSGSSPVSSPKAPAAAPVRTIEPDIPMPSFYPSPAPVPKNKGFEPFPTMHWWPFPKMDFQPFPTMEWIPFQPIGVPADATPCKRSCDHACGQTMINGETFCCEPNAYGGCGTTTIDGKCYCS